MTKTPLSIPPIKLASSMFLLCWILAYASIFYFSLGFDWKISITDALISNILLASGCVVISNMLGYYQPKNSKIVFLVLLTLILSAIIVLISKISLISLFGQHQKYLGILLFSLPFRLLLVFLCLSWCVVAHVLWYRTEEQKASQQLLLATQNLAKEAELNKLRHQLQPHFLFNSLNSVYALTIINPAEAGKMITKLATFLRGTLKRDDEIWVTVAEEMEYIQLYLDIEKVRFSHRLNIDVTIEDPTLKLQLPGTLLQPIVENAIKFGLYNTANQITITINVKLKEGYLNICVANPFDQDVKSSKGTGFGLSAIRRRLYLLFADHQLLQTEEKDNLYITTLKIPQKNNENDIN